MHLCRNSSVNSLHPGIKSDLEMRRSFDTVPKELGQELFMVEHMLYSISIKTMAPQSAATACDLSREDAGGQRDHMCACMCARLPAHIPQIKEKKDSSCL